MVEGYIANSKLLHQKRFNCVLPTENVEEEKKKKEVGQLTTKKGKNYMIENYNSFMNLSDLRLESDMNQEGELTLYGVSQCDNPNLQVDYVDSSEGNIPQMRASPMEPAQTRQVQQLGNPLGSMNTKSEIRQLLQSSATFTNCTFYLIQNESTRVNSEQNKRNQLTYLVC